MMNFKCMNKFSIAAVMSFALNMPTKRANAQSLMNLKKIKINALGRESTIGKCHRIAYRFLRLWYKYEVRKFSHFFRFTFLAIKMHKNPTGTSLSRKK